MTPGTSNIEPVLISVLIPLYNKETSIERALRSVSAQQKSAHEIIVVDDGSTDRSVARVQAFDECMVSLVRQINAGPSAARNAAAQRATGTHLLFLDGDDELLPNAIAEHEATVGPRGRADLSLASFRRAGGSSALNETFLTDRITGSAGPIVFLPEFHTGAVINVPSGCICVSRGLFAGIGGWDEQLRCWEVSDFLLRAGLASARTGLQRNVGLIVHESEDGHFGKTSAQTEYRLHFACKIANLLEEMPRSERSIMRNQVYGILHSFLQAGESKAGRALAKVLWKVEGFRLIRHPRLLLRALFTL